MWHLTVTTECSRSPWPSVGVSASRHGCHKCSNEYFPNIWQNSYAINNGLWNSMVKNTVIHIIPLDTLLESFAAFMPCIIGCHWQQPFQHIVAANALQKSSFFQIGLTSLCWLDHVCSELAFAFRYHYHLWCVQIDKHTSWQYYLIDYVDFIYHKKCFKAVLFE